MFMRNKARLYVLLSILAGPAVLTGCGPRDDTVPPGSEADSGADVVDAGELPLLEAGADVTQDGPADSNSDAESAVITEAGVDSMVEGDGEAGIDAALDAPPDGPTGPNVCGDGWRDLSEEECDDGLGTNYALDRGCTASCTVIDRVPGADLDVRERRLGLGRHPVAGGPQGHAVAMVEVTHPDAGDTSRVAVLTFSPASVRLGRALHEGVPFDADPVVAALPSGEYAVAFTDFDADDDGLGITLARVSNDGSSITDFGHANQTTEFSQRAPDMVWTGTELVVGWEDESTIPRRVCTRRFDENLTPIGSQQCANPPGFVSKVSLGTSLGSGVTGLRNELEPPASGTVYHVRVPAGTWVSPNVGYPPFDETIALAELDGGLVLAVWTDDQAGQWTTVIDASGVERVDPTPLNDGAAARFGASLAATPDGIYLSWREAWLGPEYDELWLQKLTWDGTTLWVVDAPIALPREANHQHGDQTFPALAGLPYWPSGAVLAAWNDLTATNYGGQSEHGDVAIELIPTPVLRKGLAY